MLPVQDRLLEALGESVEALDLISNLIQHREQYALWRRQKLQEEMPEWDRIGRSLNGQEQEGKDGDRVEEEYSNQELISIVEEADKEATQQRQSEDRKVAEQLALALQQEEPARVDPEKDRVSSCQRSLAHP